MWSRRGGNGREGSILVKRGSGNGQKGSSFIAFKGGGGGVIVGREWAPTYLSVQSSYGRSPAPSANKWLSETRTIKDHSAT